MNAAKHILFVGDAISQPRLRDRLASLHPEWNSTFSQTSAEALHLLSTFAFDAVVADDLLSDMEGALFLNVVQAAQPDTRSLIVCELDGPQAMVRTTRLGHQCIPKPWDSDTIGSVLERTFALGQLLSNPALRTLLQSMPVLPSPPTLYFEIVRALRSDHTNLTPIAALAEKDPALSARLLQVANSANLSVRQKVVRVDDAISYLGLETTRSIVLLAHTFSYANKLRSSAFSVERLWQHSLSVADFARRIALQQKASPETVDECYLGGLLHDVGQLLVAVNLPEQYNALLARTRENTSRPTSNGSLSLSDMERGAFRATHAEIGAELMATWNLPVSVVEALALHHEPARSENIAFSPLAAVHVADTLARDFAGPDPADDATLDVAYLQDVNLSQHLDCWRELCMPETAMAGRSSRQAAFPC